MKKILVLTLLPLALCGCKNKNDEEKSQKTPTPAPVTPFTDYLKFVRKNKFYLDLNVGAELNNLQVNLDGNLLTGGQQYSYTSSSEFSVSGDPTEEVVNIYAVYLKDQQFSCQIYLSLGAPSFVDKAMLALNSLKNADKGYVCITTIESGWNHSLNADLNNYITNSHGAID